MSSPLTILKKVRDGIHLPPKQARDHIAIEDLARTPIQHKEFFVRASIAEGYDGKSRLRIKVQRLKQEHSQEKDRLVMKDILQHRRLERSLSPREIER